ncbi:unnamed protein product [Brassica rapa subsp. trilocularis]
MKELLHQFTDLLSSSSSSPCFSSGSVSTHTNYIIRFNLRKNIKRDNPAAKYPTDFGVLWIEEIRKDAAGIGAVSNFQERTNEDTLSLVEIQNALVLLRTPEIYAFRVFTESQFSFT